MYAKTGTEFHHKNCADVCLTLTDGASLKGVVYLAIGQRLTDLLNDNRAFIPVRKENGETIALAKSQIASVSEREAVKKPRDDEDENAEPAKRKPFDPYAMLRVSPEASIEDIRAAYKARMKAVHPDTIAALDLDEDLAKAALLAAQKVNYAYQKILREREAPESAA